MARGQSGQLVEDVREGQGLGNEEPKDLMQPGQGVVVVEFDVVAHLDDLIEDCLVELGAVLEVECPVVVLFAFNQLLQNREDLVAAVQLVDYLRQEVSLLCLLRIES